VGAYASLGRLAGQAAAARTSQAQAFQAQQAALAQQAAADRQAASIAAQREVAEFNAFMAAERVKRSQAWELEKVETSARNRFELEEQAQANRFQVMEAAKLQQEQETERKKQVIIKARERGEISKDKATNALLGLELGAPASTFDVFRPQAQQSALDRLFPEEGAKTGTGTVGNQREAEKPPASQGVTTIPERTSNNISSLKSRFHLLPEEDKQKIKLVIAEGDAGKIAQARKIMDLAYPVQVKAPLWSYPGLVGPIAAEIQNRKLAKDFYRERAYAKTSFSKKEIKLLDFLKGSEITERERTRIQSALKTRDPQKIKDVRIEISSRIRKESRHTPRTSGRYGYGVGF